MEAEARELAAKTHFTEQEIAGPLKSRFAQLSQDSSGSVPIDEVCAMPEVALYPHLRRIVAMNNADRSGVVTFADFVQAISMLSGRASMAEKLRTAFSLYDIKRDGNVDSADVFNIFRLMTGRQHSDDGLQQIVDSFMQRFPAGLTSSDFAQMFSVADLAKLTLNL